LRVQAIVHGHRRQASVERGEVEEHERLDELAEVRGAHQPRDGPVGAPARAKNDLATARLELLSEHDYTSIERDSAPATAATPSFLSNWMSVARSVFESPPAVASMTAL